MKTRTRLLTVEAAVERVLGDDVLTPLEVASRLPGTPERHVRRALLDLHRAGRLSRLTDSQCVLYAALSAEETVR